MEQTETLLSAPELLGYLMKTVAAANRRFARQRIYSMEYYGGKHIWIRRRDYAFAGWTDITPRDTRVTGANLKQAIEDLRKDIEE